MLIKISTRDFSLVTYAGHFVCFNPIPAQSTGISLSFLSATFTSTTVWVIRCNSDHIAVPWLLTAQFLTLFLGNHSILLWCLWKLYTPVCVQDKDRIGTDTQEHGKHGLTNIHTHRNLALSFVAREEHLVWFLLLHISVLAVIDGEFV